MLNVRRVLLVVAAICAMTSCSRDDEVKTVIADVDRFTNELVQKFKGAGNASKGVDEAQKYLDANRDSVHKKMESIKDVRGFQVTEETKKKMEESLVNDAKAVTDLFANNIATAARNQDFQNKMMKLINDYKDMLAK